MQQHVVGGIYRVDNGLAWRLGAHVDQGWRLDLHIGDVWIGDKDSGRRGAEADQRAFAGFQHNRCPTSWNLAHRR